MRTHVAWRHMTWRTAQLLLALVALGSCSFRMGFGAKPPTLSTAPASALTISLHIVDDERGASETTPTILAQFSFRNRQGSPVWFTPNHSFDCDGQRILILIDGAMQPTSVSLPLHPAGGAYTCVYTDERGVHTALRIAMPAGVLAITSPAAGAAVRLPHASNGSAQPAPTPIPTTYTTPPPQRSPALVSQPALVLRYSYPTPPAGASQVSDAAQAIAQGVIAANHQWSGQTRLISEPGQAISGVALLTDYFTPYGYGFESLQPAPGSVGLSASYQWTLASAFDSVQVKIEYSRTAAINWVA